VPVKGLPWYLTAFLAWSSVILGLFVGSCWLFSVPEWAELSRKSKATRGTITETQPAQHLEATVMYAVEGKTYVRTFTQIASQPGQQVLVHNLADRPNVSCIGDLTGADISSNMLEHAAQRLRGVANAQLHHLHGDGLSGLGDNSFDVVYCTNTLAHLDELDRWRYVLDAFRVLRSGGRIFLDNIDLASDQGWAMFLNLVAKYHNTELPPYMARFSTATELMTYATRAGFPQVQAHHKAPLVIVTAVKLSAAASC